MRKRSKRYDKICLACRESYIGTRVATYCPACVSKFKQFNFTVSYKKQEPFVPHYYDPKGE